MKDMVKARVRVTRNFQITIPAEIRRIVDIKEGDVLIVEYRDGEIVIRKPVSRLPKIKLGRRITVEDIERYIEESIEEMAG